MGNLFKKKKKKPKGPIHPIQKDKGTWEGAVGQKQATAKWVKEFEFLLLGW